MRDDGAALLAEFAQEVASAETIRSGILGW